MIRQVEENDNGFTTIWSHATNLECGTLFINPDLPNDVFFNKLTNVSCLSEKMIDEALLRFHQANSRPYVYSSNLPGLEELLKRKKLVHYDTQYVLRKNGQNPTNVTLTKISSDNTNLWTRIFCEAYDCMEWESAVNSILRRSISSVQYFVDESNSGCMALYEKNSVLGLYCLGTVPHRRKHGIALSLVDFAASEVKRRGLEFLMLETYERDNLVNFYSKLDFENLYFKKVYTI